MTGKSREENVSENLFDHYDAQIPEHLRNEGWHFFTVTQNVTPSGRVLYGAMLLRDVEEPGTIHNISTTGTTAEDAVAQAVAALIEHENKREE